jgi:hypothetical protein
MTVNTLIKRLERERDRGRGRATVVVEPETFNTCNGAFSVAEIRQVSPTWVNVADGNGFTVENRNGSERQRLNIILQGSLTAPTKGTK